MRRIVKHYILRCRGFWRRTQGAAAVEFAILAPVLALLILGGMDLGHMYYMKYLTSNASRGGARYAAKYTGTDAAPTSAEVSDYVKLEAGLNYSALNLDTLTVTTTYAGSFPNKIATVSVSAVKHWWLLGHFNFYGFEPVTDPQTLTATTAMNVEH
ncbi:MAG: pilus assembly protein [Deltaproteobacteria bacterium]|nr:pilus assembly protein [Deltaproteobacteria bacterium]